MRLLRRPETGMVGIGEPGKVRVRSPHTPIGEDGLLVDPNNKQVVWGCYVGVEQVGAPQVGTLQADSPQVGTFQNSML